MKKIFCLALALACTTNTTQASVKDSIYRGTSATLATLCSYVAANQSYAAVKKALGGAHNSPQQSDTAAESKQTYDLVSIFINFAIAIYGVSDKQVDDLKIFIVFIGGLALALAFDQEAKQEYQDYKEQSGLHRIETVFLRFISAALTAHSSSALKRRLITAL